MGVDKGRRFSNDVRDGGIDVFAVIEHVPDPVELGRQVVGRLEAPDAFADDAIGDVLTPKI